MELVKVDDSQTSPVGMKGTAFDVDDAGNIMVPRSNGVALPCVVFVLSGIAYCAQSKNAVFWLNLA